MAISFPVSFIGAQSVANPLAKTYGAPVSAGDVLVAFVFIYNAAETCTGVSDSVNGAWTQAFGPVNAGNGTRQYGFYRLNSAAGTPIVSASFSSGNHHEIEISVISGLAGGGAFDQHVANAGLSTNPSVGPSATLGAAVCAVVAGQTNSGVVPTAYGSGWTLDGNLDLGWQKTSFLRQVTSANTALTASWTQGNSYWCAGLMVFRDAGGGGTDASAPGATLTGASAISAGTATGGSGSTGNFVTDVMENNSGAGLLANTSVLWSWYQGAIGAAPTSTTHGAGTTNALGVLTAAGLPTGAGFLLVRTVDGSGVYYQPGTVT